MRDATDVVSEVLAADGPSAQAVLDALDNAGYVVVPIDGGGPSWMPATDRSRAKVYQYAELARDGATNETISAQMGISTRHGERYAAAAQAVGLLSRRR
ncbi:hypothetical protein ACQP1V_43180 (plasmid) [Microtetraspora malaysiensis]|uniref:hypothetical protein n=1 Tax=Microtetraspora malaysiensis TaxID=161358 RepID=UPI003D8BA0C3